ncbi:MAG: hypothetical protein IPJ01_07570 [Micavibrio sp.]|nr:hypothetical protein [Micavibrio sp.]
MIVKAKPRNIFYASHVDGYIYSYYCHQLQKKYDAFLKNNGLHESIIAYRSIVRNGDKCSNIHFAKQAFDFVKRTGGCHISCYDLSKFFDKLDPRVLEQNWATILGKKTLPQDHKVVFKQLTNFSYVEEKDLVKHFRHNFEINPRQHGYDKESGGSGRYRVCTYPELRALHRELKTEGKRLIKPKGLLDMTGIAQGTSISGLLANIFMLEFDRAFQNLIQKQGGLYLRYSDDLMVVYPQSIDFAAMEDRVCKLLRRYCGDTVLINADKTEDKIFHVNADGKEIILSDEGKASRVQYLGFHFDGKNIHIRNSSVSKDRGKTVQSITKNRLKKNHGKIDTRGVYKAKSHRKTTNWNPESDKGFVRYANRAVKVFDDSPSLKKQTQKTDKFIRRAVKRERDRLEAKDTSKAGAQ